MTLFEECLEVLGEEAKILTNEQSKIISEKLQDIFLFTNVGKISSKEIFAQNITNNIQSIFTDKVFDIDEEVYIIWDNMLLPVIKSKLSIVFENIDDVTAVSFDTWIFSETKKFVIEFYHENEVTFFQQI